jgi:hypothetical protein
MHPSASYHSLRDNFTFDKAYIKLIKSQKPASSTVKLRKTSAPILIPPPPRHDLHFSLLPANYKLPDEKYLVSCGSQILNQK